MTIEDMDARIQRHLAELLIEALHKTPEPAPGFWQRALDVGDVRVNRTEAGIVTVVVGGRPALEVSVVSLAGVRPPAAGAN